MVAKTISTDRNARGFSVSVDASAARRQLRMSLGLVVALSAGIVSAAVAVGGHPLAAKRDVIASRAPVTVMHAETNVVGAKPI